MTKRILAICLCSTAILGVGATAAAAGEITGNGKSLHVDGGGKWGTALNARSECAFSGLEDATGSPLQTQTPHAVWFGPEVGVVYPGPGTPGMACSPGRP
jgi:hypothetical protein